MGIRVTGIEQIKAALDNFVRDATLEDPGLGRSIAQANAEGVQARAARKRGPDNSPWAENQAKYRAWKEKHAGSSAVGVLTGQMLSSRSMIGRAIVGRNSVRIEYGTGIASEKAVPGRSGGRNLTDVEKLTLFEAGSAKQKPRRVLGADDKITERIVLLVRDHLARKLREHRLT